MSLRPNRCVPFHAVIMIYDNDVNVMSPFVQLCTDTTEIDHLIAKIAHINIGLNMHNLHKDTRKRLHVLTCKHFLVSL